MRLGQYLQDALEALPLREREILRLRYLEQLTFREIGEQLGLSIERIRQLCARAEYRLARRIVYPGLDPLHRFDRRDVPSNYVPSLAGTPQRRPPITRNWTSEHGPPPALAPFGTLGDVLELLDRYPLEEKIRFLNEALARLAKDEPDHAGARAAAPTRFFHGLLTERQIGVLTRLWRDSPAAALPGDIQPWEVNELERHGLAEWVTNVEKERIPDITCAGVCQLQTRGIRK